MQTRQHRTPRRTVTPRQPAGRHSAPLPRPRRGHLRGGFTLVELLMVIIVIALLMALLLPAINNARIKANEARVVAEINQLGQAIAAYKTEFGLEPPSKIQLFLTQAGWDANPYSKGIIKRMWPQFDFSMPAGSYPNSGSTVVQNWANTTTADGAGNKYVALNSGECLMFFLGGILVNGAPTGFSKNPAYPFSPTGTNRKGPFLEFDPGRIKDSDNSGMPEYFDSIPSQTKPLLYFSSYEGKGYSSGELPVFTLQDVYRTSNSIVAPPGTATFGLPAQKPQSFQIISPGYDNTYGQGGVFNPNLANAGLQDRGDYDNLTNFNGGRLNP